MAKLARKLVKTVNETLGRIYDKLDDHGAAMVTIRRELERQPLLPEVDRVEALLGGVKAALERIGGNVLPSFVADVHGLRDEMARFRRDMDGYSATLMDLRDWLDRLPVAAACAEPEVPQRSTQGKPRKKRKYTKKLKPEVEILSQAIAPHNEIDEEEPVKP